MMNFIKETIYIQYLRIFSTKKKRNYVSDFFSNSNSNYVEQNNLNINGTLEHISYQLYLYTKFKPTVNNLNVLKLYSINYSAGY